ncbi:hypothetical protein LX32DRAFT_637286 [Colletotrichum zoysiae]|uniref:Uncharacterized protein n=1 Tax=Colletotrichum zoysiae TaxID=1216348 RepID=A0AAD9M2B0_9PEZI|nr:hypothetical protein LX32DRAFT_637286 [Colletotrichum zoysiae]
MTSNDDDFDFEQDPDYYIPPPKLTLLQRLTFRNPDRYVESVRRNLGAYSKGLGRHPTQEEVNVICHIFYKDAQTVAWALPVSGMVAAALTWRGRGTYRFPFFQPTLSRFNPSVFPTATAPLMQGRLANRMWHFTRFIPYFALSTLCFSPLFFSYASSVAVATIVRDERLNQFRQDMKAERLVKSQAAKLPLADLIRQRQHTISTIRSMETNLAKTPTEEEIFAQSDDPDKTESLIQSRRLRLAEGQRMIEELRRILAHINELIEKRSGSDGDEASAQNKDYEALSDSSSAGVYTLPMEPNRAPPISYSREPPSSERRSGWGLGQKGSLSQQDSSSSSYSSASDDLDIDDASPLAPAVRSQSSGQSSGSGSAWDRVRQASKQPSQASGGAQAQQSESDAYYTYDAVDKEKNTEKDKAQAEFDAMIEKERRGGK